jgi:hypothetical protein
MNSSASEDASGLAVLVKCRSISIITYRRYGRAGDEPSHQHHTSSQTSSLPPSNHQPDHVAFQQQRRFLLSAIV